MESVDEKGKSTPMATGFLMQYEEKHRHCCLITCKHVAQSENLWIRYNTKPSEPFAMVRQSIAEYEKYGLTWCFHPNSNVDLATIIPYFPDESDIDGIPPSFFGDFDKTAEGDDIFFLGFPLGITGEIKVTPVVRSGIIALKKEDYTYLIEANAFPGSSGSPVLSKLSIVDWEKKTIGKVTLPKLIGVVHNTLTYMDYAISPHTGRHRVSFEENAALAGVYSIEIIKQLLESSDFKKQQSFVDKHPTLGPITHQIFRTQAKATSE